MSPPAPPKLTIITPSFNQGAYIEQTILSVLSQKYLHVEHIVIDGGSTDSTVDVLKQYPHLLWVSEKDRGQGDALNKGFARATGDIIGWINSDDYYEEAIFESVVECFQDPDVMWAIGNLTYVFDQTNDVIPRKSPVITYERLVSNPDILRQQPAFFRKEFIERAGKWNPDYFMAMDFDLWIRLSRLSLPRMADSNWAYFRHHALQKTSHANALRQQDEIVAILRRENAPSTTIAAICIRKRWLWMKGLVKEVLIRLGIISLKYRSRPIRHKAAR
ncbi:MAG: glycosyltransferase [Nitrospira sp.]|nr:glycosyltransferase [Nitrospira sp.]